MVQPSRAVLLVAGAGLVLAWLAAAADRQTTPSRDSADSHPMALARAEHLAREIQAQAARLRSQLESAPQPTTTGRNPFVFEERPPRTSRRASVEATTAEPSLEAALAMSPPEAPLTLSGIAEETAAAGNPAQPVRIAVLSGYGDVFLAKVGETIATRYQVTAIAVDAVELTDLMTGRAIRLSLR